MLSSKETKLEYHNICCKMGDSRDTSVHYTAIKICEDLQNASSFKEFFEDIQKLVASSNVKQEDFKASLLKAMVENGLEAELRNSVYHWIRTKTKDSQTSNAFDAYLKKTQGQWERRIHKSLNSMGSELGIPLAAHRQPADKEELQTKWTQLNNYDIDINKYRPVYAPKDFLEILLNLNGPNQKKAKDDQKWEFCHVPIRVKDLHELRNLYSEFARGELVMGVSIPANAFGNYAVFETDRIQLGEKVILSNHAPVAQEYLKRGCPTCLRAKIWTIVLGAEVKPTHYEQFERLKSDVLNLDLITDKLIIKDIHLTASNDDQYFVFEDVLYQVLLCFTRDGQILKDLPDICQMQVTMKGRGVLETTMTFPPSGVIPFHGFTMYAAPFCYLYDNPVPLYQTFKAMYTIYFHKLHKVSGSSQGVVALCLLYERLLQCHEPSVWLHFKQLNIPPIKVVVKWIMRAFSGYLPQEQLLYLWDIILAYDSLEIIPLLATSIVVFRKNNLLRVKDIQSIEAVLADLSSINVMSLLQMALAKEFS